MEVDNEQFSLEDLTNYDVYMDLKPPERLEKIVKTEIAADKRTEVFGKPARLSSSIKIELLDIPAGSQDDLDAKKFRSDLNKLVDRENGALSRTIESLETLFDNVLFSAPHPLAKCRPDYTVEVCTDDPFINLIGEVKPYPKLALDTYRLGVFFCCLDSVTQAEMYFSISGQSSTNSSFQVKRLVPTIENFAAG
ncbi:hypothetical protein EDC96DRAFT_541113 [Choanephora cucurbitarum]|nr:hypothetical protein EDC96DRAFT_541113 [Choanephora cucurbitarum]